MASNALVPSPVDLATLAHDLKVQREARKLARQQQRRDAPPTRRNHVVGPPSIDPQLYANVGRYAGNVVLAVFEQLGGADAMADWAEENPTDFYTKLFPRIVTAPRQVEISGSITIEEAVKALDMQEGVDYHVVEDEYEHDPSQF